MIHTLEVTTMTVYAECAWCEKPFRDGQQFEALDQIQRALRDDGWLLRKVPVHLKQVDATYCCAKCREEHMTSMAEAAYEGE